MWRRWRPPLALVAAAMLGLIVVLAVLQYRGIGQISEAERQQRRATLSAGALEFAQDFDREITRAYLLFQAELPWSTAASDAEVTSRFAARYDRWQASARFPGLLKEFYTFSREESGGAELRRFDPATRQLTVTDWPESLRKWKDELEPATWNSASGGNAFFIRRMPSSIWEDAPALVVPTPFVLVGQDPTRTRMTGTLSYSLLIIDRDFVARDMLPALAARYFGQRPYANRDGHVDGPPDARADDSSAAAAAPLGFNVAVRSRAKSDSFVYQSAATFAPAPDAQSDATADFFQVRTQDFLPLAAEVRRFTAQAPVPEIHGLSKFAVTETTETRPLSIVIQPGPRGAAPIGRDAGRAANTSTSIKTETRVISNASPHWTLVVSHPSGSLEAAVAAQRRRNLAISSSVLGLLGGSLGLLFLATRRAQRLATQQMEFVAAVSHELRTPLAVIRSAAENLADGVVQDEAGIRRYGEVMRTEGRRLTDMVEQILEFAGIQSGQRGFSLRAVSLGPLLSDILSTSAPLIKSAGLVVDFEVPANLPPALGDEPALRRVFQNLVDNAVKYSAAGGSIKVDARAAGAVVIVGVTDHGIGIDAADQARIFEPFYRAADVVAAQVQGAGLGLSLVQRIVTAHGGRISVTSAPREGSVFSVELPVADPRASGHLVPDSRSSSSYSGGSGEDAPVARPT